jgi:tetratricopeptide (TPR) repeat protein
MRWPVECYFERAVRFQPNDATVHQIYAYYLVRLGRKRDALTQIDLASNLGGDDNANLHYNIGLVYFDLGEYDKSLEHARKAYELGFELSGLKNKLAKAGKWKDAP